MNDLGDHDPPSCGCQDLHQHKEEIMKRIQGGFTDVAACLSTSERPVTRQQVYMWWLRRERNGFPQGRREAAYQISSRFAWVFDLEAVHAWYDSYKPAKGGRPAA